MKQMKKNLKIIGLGGIGTCLYPQLYQYLSFRHEEWSVMLIDGDHYEEKNKNRQFFDFSKNGTNKAQANCDWYKKQFPSLQFRYKDKYIDEQNVIWIQDGDIVMMGVDNHKTRKLVSDWCSQLSDITLISGGNALTNGDVMLYTRKQSNDITPPLTNDYHPEIKYPQDRHPNEIGCDELVESVPQLLPMNLIVSSWMICALDTILALGDDISVNNVPFHIQYVDIRSGASRPVKRD